MGSIKKFGGNRIMKDWSEYKPEKFPLRQNGRWVDNWFSNMVPCKIIVDGEEYNSVENYYQAMKTLDKDLQCKIAKLSPAESKKIGNQIDLRSDWDDVCYEYMKKGLCAKFKDIPEWGGKLLATGNDMIIEWNNWGDKKWGVTIDDCKGKNLLGKALMEIRLEIFHDLENILDEDNFFPIL